jgi:hypothetical protein
VARGAGERAIAVVEWQPTVAHAAREG